MGIIEPTNFSSATSSEVLNGDDKIYNDIVDAKGKKGLSKVAKEFESIFITKMFSVLDKTVDREGGILGNETSYYDNLKSYMFNEIGRTLANNPHTSFGIATQIYEQMEKNVDSK